MSGLREHVLRLHGESVRVWEKGAGRTVGVLAGLLGFSRWTPFLEALSQRHHVVVPALPGHPGGGDFRMLDDLPDWVSAALDLLDAADLEGADLIGFGPGAMLAVECAVFSRTSAGKLVLAAPFGLFDEREPVADLWARRANEQAATFSARPDAFARDVLAPPAGADADEFRIAQLRALEAAARLLWPTGDRGLAKRLHRVRSETLLIWGERDAIVPASYAKRFAAGISAGAQTRILPGAGHAVDFDAPEELAAAIEEFLGE
ncbi:MAG TPA: alpha/beta hydrolase [Myxococcota bacterium]|nr:alpha/beta hydrolase [Myxococcota bacterium]